MQRPRDISTRRLREGLLVAHRLGSVWREVWLEAKSLESLSVTPRGLDFSLELPELTRGL